MCAGCIRMCETVRVSGCIAVSCRSHCYSTGLSFMSVLVFLGFKDSYLLIMFF